jgi:hypothetical protein
MTREELEKAKEVIEAEMEEQLEEFKEEIEEVMCAIANLRDTALTCTYLEDFSNDEQERFVDIKDKEYLKIMEKAKEELAIEHNKLIDKLLKEAVEEIERYR